MRGRPSLELLTEARGDAETRTRRNSCTICGKTDYSDGISFAAGGGVCGWCLHIERAGWNAARPVGARTTQE